jgi:hypothetical protein
MESEKLITDIIYILIGRFYRGEISGEYLVKKMATALKGRGKKSFWFRWFENDTLATDARSIESSLQSKKNTEYLMECIEFALEHKSIILYYS